MSRPKSVTDPACRWFPLGSRSGFVMHYYQFHIGDYVTHTKHLTLLEDLAFRRLLDHYYLHEQPIRQREIARQIGMRDHEQEVLSVLEEFFVSTEDGYINPRADKEIAKYNEFSEAGKRGAAKRWSKGGDSPPNATPIATNNHKPITNNQEPLNTNIVEDKPSTIAECPHEKILDLWQEVLPEMPQHLRSQWNSARQQALRVRWRAVWTSETMQSEEEALDYWRRLFVFVRGSKFLMGKVTGANRKPFQITLEWLIKPANFSKVVEGKYHE